MNNLINLTDNAKKQVELLCNKHDKDAVRLAVQGGGCAGFKYNWDFINEDEIGQDDEVISLDNGKFVIDGAGVLFVAGTTIDYVEEVFGSHFDIKNPSATSSCGCGESFGV